jgi:hypothetical protein
MIDRYFIFKINHFYVFRRIKSKAYTFFIFE